MFANRLDAGRQLGAALLHSRLRDPIVVGVSRGGVPVAGEVAHVLGAPLDICVVRKLFTPGSPAFAFGAVAEYRAVYLDETEIAKLRLSPADVQRAVTAEESEVMRLGELLRDAPALPLQGRDVILVDDAVTTLDTLRASVRAMRTQHPASLTFAAPVANTALLDALRPDVDRIVTLVAEKQLVAAGTRYHDFSPVSENEVAAVLASARDELAQRRKAS